MRVSRRQKPSSAHADRWLVSYADLITLLFALFVVLYSISKADQLKLKQVAGSMQSAFSSLGSSSLPMRIDPNSRANPNDPIGDLGNTRANPQAPSSNQQASSPQQSQELTSLREALEETLSLELNSTQAPIHVQIEESPDGFTIQILARDFYLKNATAVPQDFLPLLDRIGRVLAQSQQMIRIEGHAAKDEESKGYSLSSGRAESLAQHWIEALKIDPMRVSVAGYSSYQSLEHGTDSTERRVGIKVLKRALEERSSP